MRRETSVRSDSGARSARSFGLSLRPSKRAMTPSARGVVGFLEVNGPGTTNTRVRACREGLSRAPVVASRAALSVVAVGVGERGQAASGSGSAGWSGR